MRSAIVLRAAEYRLTVQARDMNDPCGNTPHRCGLVVVLKSNCNGYGLFFESKIKTSLCGSNRREDCHPPEPPNDFMEALETIALRKLRE
jgi:hypothetical protein